MSHGCDNLTGAIRENIKINRDEIKVFYMDKVNDIIYRRILKPGEYSKNECGQITLPENHYSRGYIERVIDGANWEDYPIYKQ
jgi:hypothetical protein